MEIEKLRPIQYEILGEIGKAIASLGGNSGLIAAVMSWGDTLPEADVLEMLKDWNVRCERAIF